MKKLSMILLFLTSWSVSGSILPPNDLHLQDGHFIEDANMTETEFDQIIDKVLGAYSEVVAGHGANLVSEKLWESRQVNAFAKREGNNWVVQMHGGLARRPEVSKDGFAIVVCHELGHHLGGFPVKVPFSRWAASEGQSDYFASQSCAREIWKDDIAENKKARLNVNPTVQKACDLSWESENDQNICYRSAMASKGLATLLASGRTVSFETPDERQVSSTNVRHPAGQCRLDTYFAGSICKKEFNKSIIPGINHPDGLNSLGAELEAAMYSCTRANGEVIGSRPSCWYRPQVQELVLSHHGH